jgi:AraC-like DNA-binding protein
MDLLSEVLSAVRLEGALFFNAEFTAPWCLSSSGPTGIAPYISPKARHLIIFHFLTDGHAYAALKGGKREELNAGDIVIFPHGDSHLLGNGPPQKPVDSVQTFASKLSQGLKVVHYGGGGELTRFVCGYMACDPHLSETFLAGLPHMLKVSVANEVSGRWIENSIRFSVNEMSGPDAGSSLVVEKLSEVLFVETLRRYITALPPNQTGWLAGARDAIIGKALALLHADPTHPWTVDDLAHRVGVSRTRLGERFRHFLGLSPIAYLTEWRMKLGAEALQTTENSVAEVAAAVGYNSEAAFNRAFKRAYHAPPAQFRQKRKTPRSEKKPPAQLLDRRRA